MIVLAQLVVGAVAAAGLILLARRHGRRGEILVYAAGLVVAALIYVAFAAAGGDPEAVWTELLGLGAYAAVAALGWWWKPLALALGWAAHAGWDALRGGEPYVPGWYAIACLGFDLLLAAYIAFTWRTSSHRVDARTKR